MYAIVAVDNDWGIGYQGQLLYHISEDMKRFKMRTRNRIVVMGRKTFESLPKGKPLKDRINIVLSRQDLHYKHKNVIVMHSVEEVLNYCEGKESYCIGGEEIYKLFLPYCDKAYVTVIKKSSPLVDTYFPNLSKNGKWELLYETSRNYDNDIPYTFRMYTRLHV